MVQAGETIAATFLFTDLVGSTELASGMSSSDAEALRQTHFGLLRGAIEAAGGREVKNLGDGLMVVFLSPSRALACAVEMQQAIDRHNRRSEVHLAVRVGLSTGEAVEEDADFFGDPVVEAARLCARAAGGQILATALLQLNLGRRATQEFAPMGDLELKGLPEPVPAVEVVWEPSQDEAMVERAPLPSRLASTAASGLFGFSGRSAELDRLSQAHKRSVSESRLQVVVLSGEPGVGKSSLAAQAARSAHGEGATVLFGACAEGTRAPYQPWISALSHLVRHCPAEALGALSPVHAGALQRLLVTDAALLPEGTAVESDADTEQYLLMDSVVRLLELGSAQNAVFAVIDDLHWADAASLALLRHLIGSSAPLRMSIVATYRDSDLSPSHPLTGLLADLHREASVGRLQVGGLDDAEIIELVETASGYQLDDSGIALAHALRRETGGNPFFVGELLRHLGESGAIVQDQTGRYSLTGDLEALVLPPSVRDVVTRRVARLGDETLQVLSVASVIGQDFVLDILGDVTDTDPDPLLDVLERATTAALVVEAPEDPGRYRFSHALIQHTLYQELSAARRQRLHLRIAEVLEGPGVLTEDRSTRLAELARHWQAATTPTNAAKAIDYSRRAGDAAKETFALVDAARWYSQALELAERDPSLDPELHCRLLIDLGSAQLPTDPLQGRATLRRAGVLAEEIDDPELLVTWALTRLNSWVTSEAADPEVLRITERALASVGDNSPALRARLLAALAEETDPRKWRDRRALADAARAAAAEADDDGATLDVHLMTSFMMSADQARHEPAIAARAVALAEQARNPVTLANVLSFQMGTALTVGDFIGARRALDRQQALAESFALPILEATAENSSAGYHMAEGNLAALEQAADNLLRLSGQVPTALATYGGCLFELRWAQGRLDEFVGMFSDAMNDLRSYAGFRPALVITYLEAGEHDKARLVFADDADEGFESFPRDVIWLACMALFAEAAIRLRDEPAARALYDQLSPYGDLHASSGPIYYGLTDRVIGNLARFLGRGDEAETRLRHALQVHREVGANYWTARTAIDLIELLLGLDSGPDRRTEMTQLLKETRDLALSGGYGSVSRRFADLEARGI